MTTYQVIESVVTPDRALEVLRDALDGSAKYTAALERRLADLVNGHLVLTSCEVDSGHPCPKCHQRTIVKVPLVDTGQAREGVPGHVDLRKGPTGGHRYVCQYQQQAGIWIGPCGWVGYLDGDELVSR